MLNSDLERCCDCQFFTSSPFFSGLTLFYGRAPRKGSMRRSTQEKSETTKKND